MSLKSTGYLNALVWGFSFIFNDFKDKVSRQIMEKIMT